MFILSTVVILKYRNCLHNKEYLISLDTYLLLKKQNNNLTLLKAKCILPLVQKIEKIKIVYVIVIHKNLIFCLIKSGKRIVGRQTKSFEDNF